LTCGLEPIRTVGLVNLPGPSDHAVQR
jgi:hypothetical protein